MIAVLDYGMGNLHSVSTAVERLGYEAAICREPEQLAEAAGIILPGVAAFGDAMESLQATGLGRAFTEAVQAGKPALGICLGMQLLFEEGEEHGRHAGLGLLPGRVIRFEGGHYKVPHMGWNRLQWQQPDHGLTAGLEEGHVYFVHSYHVLADKQKDVIATCQYGGRSVTAMVGRGRLYGMQFHPEKSGEVGRRLLERFLQLAEGPGRVRD